MFDILHKWLIKKIGTNNCLHLNFINVGERFKDGILFTHLLHKSQVIPNSYIRTLKKPNYYAACLSNIKNISSWLQFLDITIENSIIHQIACGQSLAVTKLLYELYFKLEILKPNEILTNIKTKDLEKLKRNNMDNLCKSNNFKSNSLIYLKKTQQKKNKLNLNNVLYNILKLYFGLKNTQYNAIDFFKTTKCIENKSKILYFLQNNMNNFYDLFMQYITNQFFKNESIQNNDICKIIVDILNSKQEDNIIINPSINMKNKDFIFKDFDSKHEKINYDSNSSTYLYISQEDIESENSTFSSLETEELTTIQTLDEHEQIYAKKQDILSEYLQHSGVWSSEYLNTESYKYKQNILSMVLKNVLHFYYIKSKIKFIKIKKKNVAGVIDIIQNTKVIHLIKNKLENKGILLFTVNDVISACLNAYKEEINISVNKGKLCQVMDEYEQQMISKIHNKQIHQTNLNEINGVIKSNLISSIPSVVKRMSEISTESIFVTNEELILKNINKLTQTPEIIPEPDYSNPVLSPLANLGKLINEKHIKNYSLEISDVINCIGEFINKYQGKNGWILLEYPVKPLQMTLLEYKLTGKIPSFGKEICKHKNIKSKIIPEYQENDNTYFTTNSYLTHCIKIIKHRAEINTKKWINFIQFYEQKSSIKILISHFNNVIKQPEMAAEILVGLILNEKYELKTKNIFKLINILSDDNDIDSTKSYDDDNQSNNNISTLFDEKPDTININQITNQFYILNTDLSWNEDDPKYTSIYLTDMWLTMEHNYVHQIKELLNYKNNLFDEIKLKNDLITNTLNQNTQFHNPYVMNLVNKYINEPQVLLKSGKKIDLMYELQINLWEKVDSNFKQLKQFIKHTINDQWVVIKNNTLFDIYKQLIKTELGRAITTINFLNSYYDATNKYKLKKFDYCTDIIDINEIDKFQKLCLHIISKLKKYVHNNYEVNEIVSKEWMQSILTEKNRFIDQIIRIKASILLDKKYLNTLIRLDHYFNKIYTVHQFKINDINKLCKLLKCEANVRKNINGHVKQISEKMCINELSVFEIFCKQIYHSKEHFHMTQLKTITNKLLANFPRFKMSINDLIDVMNEVNKIQQIYPIKWPINNQLYNNFLKDILGSNIITIDWRDFVVQCMELPYPSIEQILFYRKLFQTYDIGNEMITVQNYKTIKLWFESKSNRHNEAKWLLYDMYQVQNTFNYSNMLLAFCRDKQPWIGLGKSLILIFDQNLFNLKKKNINPSNYQHKKSIINTEGINSDINSSDLFNEEFLFDESTMTWFLEINLKNYINNKKIIGNINISQIVKLVFEYIQTNQLKTTIINLFQNDIMNDLYKTTYKFKIKELSEVVINIVKKYNLNINI